jgi:hypothetical protein
VNTHVPPDLGCAQCGDCCERIWMPPGFDENAVSDSKADMATRAFVREHWTRELVEESGWQQWSCAFFDTVHRTCKAHDKRPPVCSQYPWYGKDPHPGKIDVGRCSYLLDLPPEDRLPGARPLIPVTVLLRRVDN